MDNVLKAIIAAGVINLLTDNLIVALSAAWIYYYYETQKD